MMDIQMADGSFMLLARAYEDLSVSELCKAPYLCVNIWREPFAFIRLRDIQRDFGPIGTNAWETRYRIKNSETYSKSVEAVCPLVGPLVDGGKFLLLPQIYNGMISPTLNEEITELTGASIYVNPMYISEYLKMGMSENNIVPFSVLPPVECWFMGIQESLHTIRPFVTSKLIPVLDNESLSMLCLSNNSLHKNLVDQAPVITTREVPLPFQYSAPIIGQGNVVRVEAQYLEPISDPSEEIVGASRARKRLRPLRQCLLCDRKIGGLRKHVQQCHLPWYVSLNVCKYETQSPLCEEKLDLWKSGTPAQELNDDHPMQELQTRGYLVLGYFNLVRQYLRLDRLEQLLGVVKTTDWWLEHRGEVEAGDVEIQCMASVAAALLAQEKQVPFNGHPSELGAVHHLVHWRALSCLLKHLKPEIVNRLKTLEVGITPVELNDSHNTSFSEELVEIEPP